MLNITKVEKRGSQTTVHVEPTPTGLNATELRRKLPDLVEAYTVAKDHAEAFADTLKAVAEKHKLAPAVLRRFIASHADSEKRQKLAAQTEQMSLLLDLDA